MLIFFLFILQMLCFLFFFFNDTATPEISPLSLHDAFPISAATPTSRNTTRWPASRTRVCGSSTAPPPSANTPSWESSAARTAADSSSRKRSSPSSMKRSEEHTSELQSHSDLVCRLLLEKKK